MHVGCLCDSESLSPHLSCNKHELVVGYEVNQRIQGIREGSLLLMELRSSTPCQQLCSISSVQKLFILN